MNEDKQNCLLFSWVRYSMTRTQRSNKSTPGLSYQRLSIKFCGVSRVSVSSVCALEACRCDEWISNDKQFKFDCRAKWTLDSFLDELEIYNYVLDTVTSTILLQPKELKLNIERYAVKTIINATSFTLIDIEMDTEVLKTNWWKFMC